MEAILHIKNKSGKADEPIAQFTSIVLGRSRSSGQIAITDGQISANHCRIFFKEDRMEIEDLDSKNGTYLNGIRIEKSEVFVGDEIRIGETIITINETLTDPLVLEILTFPGPFKDRIDYELKADFTGARIQNQLFLKEHKGEINPVYQAREINIRRKSKSKILLSKAEIKSQNRVLTFLSQMVDLVIFLAVVFIPIMIINRMAKNDASIAANKATIIVLLEILAISSYFIVNRKFFRFTLGEKIMGIQELYQKQ